MLMFLLAVGLFIIFPPNERELATFFIFVRISVILLIAALLAKIGWWLLAIMAIFVFLASAKK